MNTNGLYYDKNDCQGIILIKNGVVKMLFLMHLFAYVSLTCYFE